MKDFTPDAAVENSADSKKLQDLLRQLNRESGSLPGTFVPASPLLEQVGIPTADPEQDVEEDLDFLAGVICDRIAPNLSLKMERKGLHRSNRIFSRETIETHRMSSIQFGSLPSPSENAKHHALELLSQEIEHLLHHRLTLEQERQGRSTG